MSGSHTVLALNGGSSSLKFAAYEIEGERRLLARLLVSGSIDKIGSSEATLHVRRPGAAPREEKSSVADLGAAVPLVFDALTRLELGFDAVGHRLVHGGPKHLKPERIDDALMASLRDAMPFAPLHLPGELALIEAVRKQNPDLPQVACFDTAFHASMPLVAQRLPLPTELWNEGVRRYGFHGLSYEAIVQKLGPDVAGRTIIAHLGNGASMVALHEGNPLDTTMGFTPAGGLIMGTRPGDLDPGVVVFLEERAASGASSGEVAGDLNEVASGQRPVVRSQKQEEPVNGSGYGSATTREGTSDRKEEASDASDSSLLTADHWPPATSGSSLLTADHRPPATSGSSLLTADHWPPATPGSSLLTADHRPPATPGSSLLTADHWPPATSGSSLLTTGRWPLATSLRPLATLVNHSSGLLAISETTSDMQALLAARASDPRAELATAMFCYSARKWIGALTAVLGGLDTLVFTGGIGEHAPAIREEICRDLGWLGIDLDRDRNERSASVITNDSSRTIVRVIATDEELIVAQHTQRIVFG